MYEYASVSASAYDIDSLVGKLNAHAALGWAVKSVVAAGGDVVAILQRHAEAADAPAAVETVVAAPATEVAAAVETVAVETVAVEAPVVDIPAVEIPAVEVPAVEVPSVEIPAIEVPSVDVPSIEVPSVSDVASGGFGAVTGALGGAAAAVGIGSVIDTPSVSIPEVNVPSIAEVAAPVVEAAPVAQVVETVSEPSGWGATAAAAVPAAVVPAPAPPAPAPQPVVVTPAGWYPDPSGRYEMRYWDGLAWTEHVSRQGQQFTDPPVA